MNITNFENHSKKENVQWYLLYMLLPALVFGSGFYWIFPSWVSVVFFVFLLVLSVVEISFLKRFHLEEIDDTWFLKVRSKTKYSKKPEKVHNVEIGFDGTVKVNFYRSPFISFATPRLIGTNYKKMIEYAQKRGVPVVFESRVKRIVKILIPVVVFYFVSILLGKDHERYDEKVKLLSALYPLFAVQLCMRCRVFWTFLNEKVEGID